jgi:uncharacterized protein
MMQRAYRWRRVLVLAALCAFGAVVVADVAIPPYRARVTDLTNTLTPAQRQSLEQELAQFEARKGSQIAVLVLPTTEPEAIEQYGIRVAEAWKPGRKKVDDGVILIAALKDRKIRIEVGYGLEGAIPDAVAKRVIAEVIVPFFKQGDYYGGIRAGVQRLMRLIDGEALPPAQARDLGWSRVEHLLPFIFIGVFVVGGFLRAIMGRLLGAATAGGIASVVAWFLVGSLLATLGLGVLVFLFALLLGLPSRGGYGGWNNRSGGFGGGSFGGGGGFSGGGGGGFGGGGASGSW